MFDEPKIIREPHGERRDACPCCSGDFVKAKPCDVCHECIDGDYIETDEGQVICDNCFTRKNIIEEINF